MVKNIDPARARAFTQYLALIFVLLVLLIPTALCNHPASAISGILVFAVVFFFPGYFLLTLMTNVPLDVRLLLSPIFGIVTITTAYNVFASASLAGPFPYAMVVLSVAGMILLARQASRGEALTKCSPEGREIVMAGSLVALGVAPVFWRSGRFSDNRFVFYGPAGQDHLYHVTLLQRLLHHVPPDNFMVSGLRPTVYHYFDDLTLAVMLRAQQALHLGSTDLFDLYYRCYPIVVYFLLGALAYRAGRQLLGAATGGILSVLLLLGGGGLGWCFGFLQAVVHTTHFAAMRASLFTGWTAWEGVDSILPLVHRPAHYHSLLICLAAINLLLPSETSRRNWLVAGLLLGMMAGFNFTLAATFGVATVLASLLFLLRRSNHEAGRLAWLALFIFIGSLPVTTMMLLSGFHNMAAPGFPFRGPNLEFPVSVWTELLSRITPAALVPWVSLLLFPVVAYGVKLFGIGPMMRLDLGAERLRGIALVLAIVCVVSFVIGTFFPYQGLGIAVVFLQPTLWILGLFSLRPIYSWLQRNRANWRPLAVWGMFGLTWVQALGAFNFSSRAVFEHDTANTLRELRSAAAPDDVIAYLPGDLTEEPVYGASHVSTNFAIMAMTGLDGYFSNESYSIPSAVPGLSGPNPAAIMAEAEHLYEQRRDDIDSFLKGDITPAASARLAEDNVRWIVVSGDALQSISSSATPWRKTHDMAVYRLSP